MRKILLIAISLLSVLNVSAASWQEKESVQVTNFNARVDRGQVTVSFHLQIGKKVVGNNDMLVITPVLNHMGRREQLTPVVVRGRRASVSKQSSRQADETWRTPSPYYAKNGERVRYEATVPYEEWMSGSDLVLEGVKVGYRASEGVNLGLLASNISFISPDKPMIMPEPDPIREEMPAEMIREPLPAGKLSTADELAKKFTFVAPVAEFEKARQTSSGALFDYNMPLDLGKGRTTRAQNDVVHFINGTREGALTIQFGQARRTIEREMGDNNRTLVDLISTVRLIESAEDCQIVRIVIAGFASPEGRLEDNERLAWDRASAVRDFLINNSTVNSDIIYVYNGSIDWEGLRKLVAESYMPNKYQVLQIIDNTPIWDGQRNLGRHGELMRLAGGEPYKYMLRNFFPQLRQAAYIKVYYENL